MLKLQSPYSSKPKSRQKAYADRSRKEASFVAGDKVLLSTKDLELKGSGVRNL